MHDVVIVGGGPAGLSAALMLGRARRRVLLCDAGAPRNAAAQEMHGFVTRDGIAPSEFRAIGRRQLEPYSIEIASDRVRAITGARGGFDIVLEGGRRASARRVLLASGMTDEIPERPGFRALWGRSVVLCPYCHGWELRDRALALEATEARWVEWGLFLAQWSRDLVVFAPPDVEVPDPLRERLAAASVRLDRRRITALRGATELEALELDDGSTLARDALFVRVPQRQTELVRALGVATSPEGLVIVDASQQTSIAGIYAAGDLQSALQNAVFAAADGAKAGAMLNHELAMSTD